MSNMAPYRLKLITKRVLLIVLIVGALNIFFFLGDLKSALFHGHLGRNIAARERAAIRNTISRVDRTVASDAFFNALFSQLEAAAPVKREFDWKYTRVGGCDIGDVGVDTANRDTRLSYENLARCLELPEKNYMSLKNSHAKFVDYVNKIDTSSKTLDIIYPTKRGIVTVGGGRYTLLSYLMIQMVRRSGSKLPIEVVIPPNDGPEEDFCRNIQQYNARCVLFEDRLPQKLIDSLKLKTYQVKGLALLLSSFQEFVFIDSDNMPLKNVDKVFEYDVYKDNKMVVWPDIWRRVTSPSLYEIVGLPVDLSARVRNGGDDISPVTRYDKSYSSLAENKANKPMHDFFATLPDPTTESGQMIVNKRTHLKSLLLAFYYNVYGPEYYYQLLSQGTSGQGDKETFILAAHVLHQSYYQVKKILGFTGYHDPTQETGGMYNGAGLLQFDPQQDYAYYLQLKEEVNAHFEKYSKYDENYSIKKTFYQNMIDRIGDEPREILFLHASFHKYDPWDLYVTGKLVHPGGQQFRAYPCASPTFGGFDVELFLWGHVEKLVCSNKPLEMHYVQKLQQDPSLYSAVCQWTKDRLHHLLETHDEYVSYKDTKKCVNIKKVVEM